MCLPDSRSVYYISLYRVNHRLCCKTRVDDIELMLVSTESCYAYVYAYNGMHACSDESVACTHATVRAK